MILDRFKLQQNGTTIKKEFIAGLTTFVAMLYIIPVNAGIMSQAGIPFDALVSATALITIIATIANGLWANTPIAMSVGMGLNAYFTFGLVIGMKIPWQTALGVVFISGVLYVLIALTPIRRWIIDTIPLDIKRASSAGIGAFIAFIALTQVITTGSSTNGKTL
jgi:AGZA family xanthine/uracil permease-like MFS transporter